MSACSCEEQIRVQALNILTYLSQAQSTRIDPENQNQIMSSNVAEMFINTRTHTVRVACRQTDRHLTSLIQSSVNIDVHTLLTYTDSADRKGIRPVISWYVLVLLVMTF